VLTPLLVLLQHAALQHAAHAPSPSPMAGVFGELLRVLVVLALVSAGAFWALRWIARRGGLGAGLPAVDGGLQLRVLARVALEPRKALYLVRAGERTLLLATGEAGPPSLLIDFGPAPERPAADGAQPPAATGDSAAQSGSAPERADG
jgi:flagellar biogenesis protein FliO